MLLKIKTQYREMGITMQMTELVYKVRIFLYIFWEEFLK